MINCIPRQQLIETVTDESFLACFTGVVTGNFTDEEEEDPYAGPDSGKEVLLQKDQVMTTFVDGNMVSTVNANSGLRKYFGPVVAVLIAIVIVMVAVGIVFIVLYQKRMKSSSGHTVLPGAENRGHLSAKVSTTRTRCLVIYFRYARNK